MRSVSGVGRFAAIAAVVICGRGGGLSPARQQLLQGDRRVRERQPARQGQPGADRRRRGRHGLRHRDRPEWTRAHRDDPQGSSDPLKTGTKGRDPPALALEHRRALRRARAAQRADSPARRVDDPRGREDPDQPDGHRRRPRPGVQCARPGRARRHPGFHQGLSHAVEGQGRRGPTAASSTSTRRSRPRAGSSASSHPTSSCCAASSPTAPSS